MSHKMGCLIVDVAGLSVSQEEVELLGHPLVGGVILFARNYASRAQLTDLCRQIRASRKEPLLIMVDQEGGRVQRFTHEFTQLPYMAMFGRLHDENPEHALAMAKDCGWLMAVELLTTGIDMSLAPVLDLNKGISSIIGQRAFHAEPAKVITLATAFIRGMAEAGMAATGKHFPGHGSVSLDSHVAVPVDERSMDDIEYDDLLPFSAMIKAGIPAMMAAHIIFPQIDSAPIGFSRIWLMDILRKRLDFKGVIFSDDLNMEGANISGNYTDRVIAARDAGCDFALLCNNRQGVVQVLDNLPSIKYTVDKEKWGMLQGDYTRVMQPYKDNKRWQATHEFLLETNQITI